MNNEHVLNCIKLNEIPNKLENYNILDGTLRQKFRCFINKKAFLRERHNYQIIKNIYE